MTIRISSKLQVFTLAGLLASTIFSSEVAAQSVAKVIDTGSPYVAAPAPDQPWSAGEATPAAVAAAPVLVKAPGIDESADRNLWQAIADGDWKLFDDLVSARQKTDPAFATPKAMLAARAQGERQDNIAAVMRTGSAGEIIAIAATDPKHFGCEQPGNMWHLADSYVATNDKASALTLYRQAVVTCGPDERLTAIQKARAIVDLKDVIVLIDTPGAAKNPAEADIRAEIAKAVADMSKKPGKADPNGAMMKLLAAAIDRAQPGAPVPEIAAKAAEKADKQKTAKTAEMLGWLYKKSGDNINAIAWFRKAVEWGNSKEARSGLVYVLADSGDAGRKEAMALAKTWADAVPSSMFAEDQTMAGLAEAQKAKDWAKCRELAAGAKNAAASLIGAWCAHEAGESRMALVAFKAVATSGTASAAELDDAKKGWVITAAALKDSTEIGDLRARGLLSKAEDQSLTREIGMASFWDAYTKKKYAVAMNIMAGLSDKNIPLTDKEIVTGGWAAYQSGACGKAWTAFKKLFESKDEEVRKEAQRGFRAVSGAYKSDTANICGKDHSYQGDGVFN